MLALEGGGGEDQQSIPYISSSVLQKLKEIHIQGGTTLA